MEINNNLIEVLNDLIKINNDRVEGYQSAISHAGENDNDLKAIFSRMVDESRRNISELSHELVKLGAEPVTGIKTVPGKIYNLWMEAKTVFTGIDRTGILKSCENVEDAAQKTYQEALVSDHTLSIDIRQMIAKQKALLKVSHDTIKRFLDLHNRAETDDLVKSNEIRDSTADIHTLES